MSNKKWMRLVLVMVVVIAMAICANNVFSGQGSSGERPPKPPTDDNGGPHGDRENPFEKDDTNNDGRVSRSEFNGPADMFDKMDVNGDGYIAKDELPKGPGGPGDSEEDHNGPKHE
nr:hypothetical protein [uncultured Desulfobacter sp.]